MKKGYLSEHFSGVAIKTLSSVEADILASNQHEFNGVEALKAIFGTATGKQRYMARFLYLEDESDSPVTADTQVTWYDAREAHPTRSEHRLYFPTTDVSLRAAAGDLLVIARKQDGTLLIVTARKGSTIASQLAWLFGSSGQSPSGFHITLEAVADEVRLRFASRLVLDELGLNKEEATTDFLEAMLNQFGSQFPPTSQFSAFARTTLGTVDAINEPDMTLIEWMTQEEKLFRSLEKHLICERIKEGFGEDVDAFVSYSLSIHNRRKSRVGYAFENHIEEIFVRNNIRYDRTKVTENRSRPDFIFPGIAAYHDPTFPTERLSMLGVKSSCKDRWRQVLSEARRIPEKHLLTLEPGISLAQTDEMAANGLRLVVPREIQMSYSEQQKQHLMTLHELIKLLEDRQHSQ